MGIADAVATGACRPTDLSASAMTPTRLSAVLRTDARAVTPVIGVILMIAITVILAAVVGTFMLGVGNDIDRNAPSATFEYEFSDGGDGWADTDDWINVTHTGGDRIHPEHLRGTIGGNDVDGLAANWSDPVEAGDTVAITDGTTTDHATVSQIEDGDTLRLIWNREDVDESIVIAEREVP